MTMEFSRVEQARALLREYLPVTRLAAVRRLLLDEHVVTEPSGAATTAALLKAGMDFSGEKVVLLVTGANLTPAHLRMAVGVD